MFCCMISVYMVHQRGGSTAAGEALIAGNCGMAIHILRDQEADGARARLEPGLGHVNKGLPLSDSPLCPKNFRTSLNNATSH